LTARIDNNAIADGFQIYLHTFILTAEGEWAVVRQGMNGESAMARRYHWHSAAVKDFIVEPHTGIVGEHQGEIMNLVDRGAKPAKRLCSKLHMPRSFLSRAQTGWFVQATDNRRLNEPPVRAFQTNVAIFLDGASTPPLPSFAKEGRFAPGEFFLAVAGCRVWGTIFLLFCTCRFVSAHVLGRGKTSRLGPSPFWGKDGAKRRMRATL
jgi:hypothetical protein